MTPQILLTLAILLLAILLFISQRLRVDLIALFVLVSLVATRLLTPVDALAGFSNPAVVTIWALFILSAGLSTTGVANTIGWQVLRFSGKSEARLILLIMATAAFLSAFMSNVAVVALLLPVVLSFGRQTRLSPSRLLMPLAFGCLLGGLTTLIGTAPNLLVSEALRGYGLDPLQMFDFFPTGLAILIAGTAFMILAGRHMLPIRDPIQALAGRKQEHGESQELHKLEERLALVILPPHSPLAGKTLAQSRIGSALGLTTLGLQRNGRTQMTMRPDTILQEGDTLLTLGKLDRLRQLNEQPYFTIEENSGNVGQLFSLETGLAELRIMPDSPFIGHTLAEIDMRRLYRFNVLAVRRGDETHRSHLQKIPLAAEDKLLLQGERASLLAARLVPDFLGGLNVFVEESETAVTYQIQERLLIIRIPPNSPLVGQTLENSHLSDLFSLVALGIIRDDQKKLAPSPNTILQANDLLLVEGRPDEVTTIRGLQGLIVKHPINQKGVMLESEMVGLVEAILSPHSTLANKSLRDIRFRDKYGLSVLSIWRDGRAYRSNLGDIPLQFGDALLLYGPRDKVHLLSEEDDFLVLTDELPAVPRQQKAPLAVLIMAGVIVTALVGWLPLPIAAIAGAAIMVLTGCLSMDEAYRQIDWRTVFLIAGMLPLGTALEQSGTAEFLAAGIISLLGDLGPYALLAGLFILASATSQIMPNPVVAVLMAPIALNTAVILNLSPYALMIVVAIAASASFMSPVGHPANVMVMGPGGYRFKDYVKIGLPLTCVVLIVTLLVLPIFWPLR